MKGKMIIGGGSILKGLQSGESSKEKITPRKIMAKSGSRKSSVGNSRN